MRLDERICSALLPALYRLAGRPEIRMLSELVAQESLDGGQLAQLQIERLRTLVRHCYENVPYYRDLFDALSARPEDIKSLADFERIPVLTKETVKEKMELLVASNYARRELLVKPTGGSTGIPTQFYQDRVYYAWGWAGFLRNLGWTGHRHGERQVWFARAPASEKAFIKTSLHRVLQRRWVDDVVDLSEATIGLWATTLRRIKPRLVYGYPTALSSLASHLERTGAPVDSVRRVMTSSEVLLPQQRDLIGRAFGAQVFDQYGSTEAYSIACECRHGRMHVNSDLNLVEFMALGDKPAATSARDVVVTPLLAYGMPLLRYVLGDQARPAKGRCECGLPFPLMEMQIGRTFDNVLLSDGRKIHGLSLVRHVSCLPGIRRFQFRQVMPGAAELHVLRDERFDDSTALALSQLENTIEREMGVRLGIETTFVDDIGLSASGKHRYVISELSGSEMGTE